MTSLYDAIEREGLLHCALAKLRRSVL